jgi:hypothetical protein
MLRASSLAAAIRLLVRHAFNEAARRIGTLQVAHMV